MEGHPCSRDSKTSTHLWTRSTQLHRKPGGRKAEATPPIFCFNLLITPLSRQYGADARQSLAGRLLLLFQVQLTQISQCRLTGSVDSSGRAQYSALCVPFLTVSVAQ